MVQWRVDNIQEYQQISFRVTDAMRLDQHKKVLKILMKNIERFISP